MKKIFSIIILILTLISCKKDFVDRLPTQASVSEAFYKTPEDGLQALTAVYNMMLRDDYFASQIVSEVESDNSAGGAGSTDGGGYQLWDRGLQQPDVNGYGAYYIWGNYFGGIYRANVYIQKEGNIDWKGNKTLQNQYLGEARFLRAYYHFYLTRLFGEIPYLDHPLAPSENPGRTPAAQLYAKIIEDLKFAVNNCLSVPYPKMQEANWGHATKWAAEALMARVFLFYTGYYNQTQIEGFTATDARNAIDDVIKNSGHDLVNDFASLWVVPSASEGVQYAGEMNKEVIFSARFSNGGSINTIQRMVGPRNFNFDPYGNGWGACTVLPSLWFAFDTSDTRKTASICDTMWYHNHDTAYNYELNTQAQYTGYFNKKYDELSVNNNNYIATTYGDFQTNGTEDLIIIRFADVLLMGAELYVLTNGNNDGTALSYINKVRARAFKNDATKLLSNVDFDTILKERRFELVFEDSRFWDILRSCKADFSKLATILTYVDPNPDYAATFSADANSAETTTCNVDGNNFVAKKGLLQIPQNELNLMKGSIKQNPGYN